MKMIMLGTPTHPRVNPENISPPKILPAAMAASNIPMLADTICLELTLLKIGAGQYKISSTVRIARLKKQLPKRVPKAKSGSLTKAAELTPVTSSGMEVTAARKIRPIHIRPNPVFSPIASP